jgi:hypothetical protein
MLTKEELRQMFLYKDGALYYRHSRARPVHKGQRAGTTYKGYTKIEIDKVRYPAQILIWIYHKGEIPQGWRVVRQERGNDDIKTLSLKAIR